MSMPSRLVLALAAAATPLAPALAADYDPPVYVEEAPEYVPVEVGSGWYLRGDLGYTLKNRVGQVTYATFDPGTLTYGSSAFTTQGLDKDFTFGAGFGYRYNDWLRGDLTVDGFRSDFNGSTFSATPCIGDPAFDGTLCGSQDASRALAVSFMANGYVDLGTYVGVTPYVGAGLGYSYVAWNDLSNSTYCISAVEACPVGLVGTTSHEGAKSWQFTYALMAGFAYDISQNLKLDVGYRYRHIEGGDMFRWDAWSAAAGATGMQGKSGDLDSHEIKVGLRYELW